MAPPPAAAAHNREWRALPLISRSATDSASELRIEADALAVLRDVHAHNIHVLGIFGPKATGKKLLLKTLLHSKCGFAAPQSHVLLWLWVPVQPATVSSGDNNGESVKIVLSSGTWEDETAGDRKHRLALLLLLSSALVYNDDGEIGASAVEKLDWLAEIAQILRVKANQDEAGVASDFKQHAPKFIWLAHNFKVKWLNGDGGEKLTPLQYFEKCFRDEPGFSEAVMRRNAHRMYFNSYFPSRDCVALSRPVEGTSVAVSHALERDALRAQFVESIDKLYASYLSAKANSSLPPKQLMGKALRAEQFVVVLETYVKALNSSNLPTITVASNTLLKSSIADGFHAAEQAYQAATAAVSSSLQEETALPARDLQVAHYRGIQKAMIKINELWSILPEKLQETAFQENLAAWENQVQKSAESMARQNSAISSEVCRKILQEVLPHNLEDMANDLAAKPRESFSDGLAALLSQYKSDLKKAVGEYKEQASGPSEHDTLEQALLQSVFASIKNWSVIVLRQYQQHVRELVEQRQLVARDVEAAKAQDTNSSFSAENHKHLYEEQLERSTKQLSEVRRVLLGELSDKKSELDRLMREMTTMELKHDVRVRNVENDIAWTRSRTVELEKAAMEERSRSGNDLSGATEHMVTKERSFHEEERHLLTQQKEMMGRVVQLEREIAQKKTKHIQQVFALENGIAKKADEMQTEHAEFARQLKSQTKTDTDSLKLAYQKNKVAVVTETDKVDCEIDEIRAKLALLASPVDRAASQKNSSRSTRDFFNSVSMPLPAIPIFPPSPPGSPDAGAELPTRAVSFDVDAAAGAAARNDSDLCKQS